MPATVDLVVAPADATLLVDGQTVAHQGAASLSLRRGPHHLSAGRPGYLAEARDLVVLAGERHDVAFQLAVSPETGLAIRSDPPGADIYLDGQPIAAADGTPARTNHTVTAVRPGRHIIELRSPAGVTWQRTVEVQPDRILQVQGIFAPVKPAPVGKGRRSNR
jgi:hypothetical protein